MNAYTRPAPTPTTDRRGSVMPHPHQLEKSLTDEQSITLSSLQQFGWSVAFVRRPLFQAEELIIVSPNKSTFMRLDTDGTALPFYNMRTEDFD